MMEAKWHFNAWSLPWLPTTDSSLEGQYAGKLAGTAGLPHHLLVERRNRGVLGQGPSSSRGQATQQ